MPRLPRLLASYCTALAFAGCCTPQALGKDFSELGHASLCLGMGARGAVQLGDLVHLGAGGEVGVRFGYAYGQEEIWLLEAKGNLVVLHGETYVPIGTCPVGVIKTCWQTPACHGCFGVAPVLTNRRIRTWLHRFDIDIEVMAGPIGFGLGFSPGELVELIATLFGADFDPEPWGGASGEQAGVPSPLYPEKSESRDAPQN